MIFKNGSGKQLVFVFYNSGKIGLLWDWQSMDSWDISATSSPGSRQVAFEKKKQCLTPRSRCRSPSTLFSSFARPTRETVPLWLPHQPAAKTLLAKTFCILWTLFVCFGGPMAQVITKTGWHVLSLSTDQLHDACVCSSRQHPGVCSSRRPNEASLKSFLLSFNCTFYVCLELVSPWDRCCIKNHLERFLFPPVHVEIFCSAHDTQSQVRPWPATNTSVSLWVLLKCIVLGYLLAR